MKLGTVLLIGGLAGASIGVGIFSWLRRLGQLDLISPCSMSSFSAPSAG